MRDANPIGGRSGWASWHVTTKPKAIKGWRGKWGKGAGKVNVLTWGDLSSSPLSSTLYINKLITGRRKQVFELERADKAQISRRRICLKKALLPQSPAHECQDIVEGGVRFRIPGGLRHR